MNDPVGRYSPLGADFETWPHNHQFLSTLHWHLFRHFCHQGSGRTAILDMREMGGMSICRECGARANLGEGDFQQ